MRPSRFNDVEIQQAISKVQAGTPLVVMCRTLGVTQTTFYRWRRKHGGEGVPEHREVRLLRDENHKLKQLVAELYLEQHVLKTALTKQGGAVRRGTA